MVFGRQEDVASLRKDLKSDLTGIGGSVQRAVAVQCILDADFENAMFFATVGWWAAPLSSLNQCRRMHCARTRNVKTR